MTDGEISISLTAVAVPLITLVGGYIAAWFKHRGDKEASASTILSDVWAKYGNLEARVSNLEGKVTRRDWLLMLSRGQIFQYEEAWPSKYESERPAWHPELRPFLQTGLIDPAEQTGDSVHIEVKQAPK